MHTRAGSSWRSSRSRTRPTSACARSRRARSPTPSTTRSSSCTSSASSTSTGRTRCRASSSASTSLVDAVNAMYIWGHWPLLIVGGFLLFHLGQGEYRRLRTVILLSGGLGLVVFALFPVAPPRLAPVGLRDTVTLHSRDVPHGPAAVAHQRVRRDAELPRRMESAAGDRAVPRQPQRCCCGRSRCSCRSRWRSPWSRPRITSSSTSSAVRSW